MSSYQHLILISETSNFDLADLHKNIKNINWGDRKVNISFEAGSIDISVNGWNFNMGINDSEYVIEESKEMANVHAKNHTLSDKIRSAKKRLEMGGDADFEMDYFNDFCQILQQVEAFEEVYTFNPHEGFLNI